jgi:hypothetical protein
MEWLDWTISHQPSAISHQPSAISHLAGQFVVGAATRLSFTLFVGLSLSITAFPVLVRIVGAHHLSSTRLGTVAIACAAFDDVTANIGLERGLLPPPLFAMLMLMALATTAMTSPLLRRLGYSASVPKVVTSGFSRTS